MGKHGLNIRFEVIPENWPPMLYYWYFGKRKGYHYPTDNDIKFFYFTLFKKNGFIFLIFCYIVYRNCFLDFIFIVFFIKKNIRITSRFILNIPKNLIPILLI